MKEKQKFKAVFNYSFPSQQVYVTSPPSYEGKSLYQGRKVSLPPSYEGKHARDGFHSKLDERTQGKVIFIKLSREYGNM